MNKLDCVEGVSRKMRFQLLSSSRRDYIKILHCILTFAHIVQISTIRNERMQRTGKWCEVDGATAETNDMHCIDYHSFSVYEQNK